MPLVQAALCGAAFSLSIYSVAQEGAKKVNPHLRPDPRPWLEDQPVRAKHGMVVTVHHLASDAGVEILREGGNAVDAAVATGFALAVVHPIAGNLGGGGFLLLRTTTAAPPSSTSAKKLPLAATEEMYLDAARQRDSRCQRSWLPLDRHAGLGGGLVYAERKYGRLGLKRVMAPAIKLAAEGFELTAEEAHELSDPDLAQFPESKRIFQRDGQLYKEGEIFRQPELARTLERIAADPEDFYHGQMAHELVDELKKGGALLTLDDLAQYKVVERAPIVGSFHNYTILSAPPPSSGGIVLVSALNILESYDLARLGDRIRGVNAPDHGGLPPRLHGPCGVSGRPGLQPHPGGGAHVKEVRGCLANGHRRRRRHSQRRAGTPAGVSAARAHDRRPAPSRIERHHSLLSC